MDLNYDPLPYQIIAKRIFIEEIRPNKAYFLLLLGIKRGISSLDFDAIAAFEISEIFELNKRDKIISTTSDIKKLIEFDTSFQRFSYLMENDNFLEVRSLM